MQDEDSLFLAIANTEVGFCGSLPGLVTVPTGSVPPTVEQGGEGSVPGGEQSTVAQYNPVKYCPTTVQLLTRNPTKRLGSNSAEEEVKLF